MHDSIFHWYIESATNTAYRTIGLYFFAEQKYYNKNVKIGSYGKSYIKMEMNG